MKRLIAIAAVLALMLALPLTSQASPSGSWDVSGTYGVKVTWDQDPAPGTEYPETLILTQAGAGMITGTHLGAPCSAGCADFTITGGSVVGDAITIVATSPFTLDLTGNIALDGTMSGTWADGLGGSGRTGTWWTTSGMATFMPTPTATIRLIKQVLPADGSLWNFVITNGYDENYQTYTDESAPFDSGILTIENPTAFEIDEWAGTGTDIGDYTAAAVCTDNGSPLTPYASTYYDVGSQHRFYVYFIPALADHDYVCTFTNTKIDDTGPITSAVAVTPPMSGSGTLETVTANVDDTTTGGSLIKSAEFSVGGGAWMPMAAVDGAFDEMAEDVSATFTGPLDGGTYDVCVRGTDVMDNVGDAVCTSLTVYDAYAKVSGTAGALSGNGKSLAFSFDGWVATAGDAILGKVEVNYRILRETCTYTPDANSGLTIVAGVATLTNWSSSCAAGEFNLVLKDRDIYQPRGMVSVDGPGTTYDIGLQNLVTGNVHVRDLTVGTGHGFFSASDSLYYNCAFVCPDIYGTGPIQFSWTNTLVTGGFWNEIVPPTTGTTYYNIVDGTAVVGSNVTLHFTRTVPTANDFSFAGSFSGNTLTGQMDGPYLFIATGMLIVS